MVAKIIDGNAVAKQVRAEYRTRVEGLVALGCKPGLAVILVGDNPASKVYVDKKAKACAEVGLHSEVYQFPADVHQDVIIAEIAKLNADPQYSWHFGATALTSAFSNSSGTRNHFP